MKVVAIIPARYASTRFPGKPLALLGGRPVVQRVYEQVVKAGIEAVIATDDVRIAEVVTGFGGRVVMTRADHPSGTDRVSEAYEKLGERYDVVINVQGDEPFVQPEQMATLVRCFENPETQIATLAHKITEGVDNPNVVKVVCDKEGRALYFSRAVIPYTRVNVRPTFYKHVGMYGFRAEVLREVTRLAPSMLERAEMLEQLRWLENGYRIEVAEVDVETIGIDTPEDLTVAERFLKEKTHE